MYLLIVFATGHSSCLVHGNSGHRKKAVKPVQCQRNVEGRVLAGRGEGIKSSEAGNVLLLDGRLRQLFSPSRH